MTEETIFVPTKRTTKHTDEPIQMDDVRSEATVDLPLGPKPPVSKSVTYPQEAFIVSSSLEPESLIQEFIVWLIHVVIAQSEVPSRGDLSLESEFSIPKPDIQQIPTRVESSPLVPSHAKQTVAVSRLMDLDNSRISFDSAIIKKKMAEVGRNLQK